MRFKAGDVIEVAKYWHQGDEEWLSGVIMITDCVLYSAGVYNNQDVYCYTMKHLKGTFNSTAFNAKYFDEIPYLVWLGNINDNPALKVLYG